LSYVISTLKIGIAINNLYLKHSLATEASFYIDDDDDDDDDVPPLR